MHTRIITLLLVLGVCCSLVACATARQISITADAAFSVAVFALDDAEFQACQTHVLTQAQCDKLNGPIKQALVDVKAVTLALKAAPSNGTIPHSLPDLLRDLADVQGVINALQPMLPMIAVKATDANQLAIALLTQLAGGVR